MEIRLRALAGGAVLVVALAAVALVLLRPQPVASVQSLLNNEMKLPQPQMAPEVAPLLPTVTPRLAPVTVRDESAAWQWAWQPACIEQLRRHFGETKAHDVTFVLADDPTLSLGIAYPNLEQPDAIALTRCEGESNVLTCRLSVSKGSPGASLDATVTAAALYGVEEFYRARNREQWELRAPWEWERFAPFLVQEGSAWRSTCVRLTAP